MAFRLEISKIHLNFQGDAIKFSNYRTIGLISHAIKVMLKVMQQRLLLYREQ